MNAIVSTEVFDRYELKKQLSQVPDMTSLELSSRIATQTAYELGHENTGKKIAVLDLGIKRSLLQSFLDRNCRLKVFPAKTGFEEMEKAQPEGYFLSNGPGDPVAMDYATNTAKKIINKGKPLFGVCLGNQILARAVGIDTFKMHHGHRGINHPVKHLATGLNEITSQNHGFAVSMESLQASDEAELTHVDLNNNTVEGFRLKNKPAFAVQYHPESKPGPEDSKYLFDHFIQLLSN